MLALPTLAPGELWSSPNMPSRGGAAAAVLISSMEKLDMGIPAEMEPAPPWCQGLEWLVYSRLCCELSPGTTKEPRGWSWCCSPSPAETSGLMRGSAGTKYGARWARERSFTRQGHAEQPVCSRMAVPGSVMFS